MPLTADGIRRMVRLTSSGLNHSFRPVVQVISVQVVFRNFGFPRYFAVLSDGSHFVEARLSTQLNEMVESNEVQNNAVIRVEDFTDILSHGKTTIYLRDVSVVTYHRNRIGSPTNIETADSPLTRTYGPAVISDNGRERERRHERARNTDPDVISDNDRERERRHKRARYTDPDVISDRASSRRDRRRPKDTSVVTAFKELAERQRREADKRVEARLLLEEKARATTLEVVEKLAQEKESIDKLETNLEEMKDHIYTLQDDLNSRKRSLRESVDALPSAQRPSWNLRETHPRERQENPKCVICHEKAPERAVVPCGHLCLCDECAPSISHGQPSHRFCPLCRGPASSTLRIYS